MISLKDIGWMAGLIEGEGCIIVSPKQKTLRLSIEMCDEDVLLKFQKLMPTSKVTKRKVKKLNPKHRDRYILHLTGAPMIGLLQTIYPFMGVRRQKKIEESLAMFKSRRNKPYKGNHYSFEYEGVK